MWLSIDRLTFLDSQVTCNSASRNAGNANSTPEYSSSGLLESVSLFTFHEPFCLVIPLIVWPFRILFFSFSPQ